MKKVSNILWGAVLVLIGVVWLINATGIASINIFFRGWWTMFIIIPSIIEIIKKPKDISSYIFLFVGVLLLLGARNIISFALIGKIIVPVILILIGISVIFKDSLTDKISDMIKEIDRDGNEVYTAAFSENKVNLVGDEFKGAKLDCVFGGITFDISDCDITKDFVIEASAMFGGIKIKLPRNVNVKVKSSGMFGGTDNKVSNTKEEVPTIYIESFAMFGGVEIL